MLKPNRNHTPHVNNKSKLFNGDEPPKKRHRPNVITLNAFNDDDNEFKDDKYIKLHNSLMATVATTTSFGKQFQKLQTNPPPTNQHINVTKSTKPINTNYLQYDSYLTTNVSYSKPIPSNIISSNMNVQSDFSEISNSPVSNSTVSNSPLINDHSHQVKYNPTFDIKYNKIDKTPINMPYYNNDQIYDPMKTCCCCCCNKTCGYTNQKIDTNTQNNYYNNYQKNEYSQKHIFETSMSYPVNPINYRNCANGVFM